MIIGLRAWLQHTSYRRMHIQVGSLVHSWHPSSPPPFSKWQGATLPPRTSMLLSTTVAVWPEELITLNPRHQHASLSPRLLMETNVSTKWWHRSLWSRHWVRLNTFCHLNIFGCGTLALASFTWSVIAFLPWITARWNKLPRYIFNMFYFHPLLSTPKLAKTDASLIAPPKSDPGAIGRLRSFGSSCHLQSLQVQCMELLRVGRVGRFDDPTSKANGRGQHVDLRQTLEPSPYLKPSPYFQTIQPLANTLAQPACRPPSPPTRHWFPSGWVQTTRKHQGHQRHRHRGRSGDLQGAEVTTFKRSSIASHSLNPKPPGYVKWTTRLWHPAALLPPFPDPAMKMGSESPCCPPMLLKSTPIPSPLQISFLAREAWIININRSHPSVHHMGLPERETSFKLTNPMLYQTLSPFSLFKAHIFGADYPCKFSPHSNNHTYSRLYIPVYPQYLPLKIIKTHIFLFPAHFALIKVAMDHGWLRRLQKRRAWNSAPPRCATARPPDPGAAPRRARRTSSSAGAGPCRGLARRDGQARLRDTPDLFYLMNLMILHASWDKSKSFQWGTAVCGLQITRIAETEQTRAYPGKDGGIAGVFIMIMYLHFLDRTS